MRPNNATIHANIGGARSETRFALHADSTAHLVGVLTNLYSDRLLAFVRELSTNAIDSHIVARNNSPIRVTLPSAVKPVFAVEDFGLGLGIDDLENVYTQYGASTKRDSDDVNGVLGLGCKAPLAYADTFTIRARKGGVQVLAVVAKDSDGVPVLRVLDTSATDEANGVRIEVPVRQVDFHRLGNTVEEFFQYWEKGTVLVNGQQPRSIRDDDTLIWLDDDVAVSTDHRSSVVVQHGVAYPVDYYHLRKINFSVIAYVPSGTVNFPPSREALEYTERTEDVLETLEEYAAERFEQVIRDRVAAAKTTYERLVLVQQWRQYVPKVANDFFGKFGLKVTLGSHGYGWRYTPGGYRAKVSKVESLRPNDLIGEFPIITGYPLKSLSPKNKAKIDRYFEGKGHREFLFLPPGTSLTATIGRDEMHEWDVIDAATPTVKAPSGSGYTGQTQYSIYHEGSHDTYTLREAKELIAETEGALVVYTTDTSSTLASYLSDAVLFSISPVSIDKIVRETGAVSAWEVLGRRREAALAAITTEDRLYAAAKTGTSHWAHFVNVVDQIEDPEVVEFVRAWATKDQRASVTVQAYLNLGGSLRDIARNDGTEGNLDSRYPLIANTYYVRQNIADAVIYINAKYTSLNLTTENQS